MRAPLAMASFAKDAIERIKNTVGSQKVILGLSAVLIRLLRQFSFIRPLALILPVYLWITGFYVKTKVKSSKKLSESTLI